MNAYRNVSIQLIAPASGAPVAIEDQREEDLSGFHSTDCPSEWGHNVVTVNCQNGSVVSIQLIAPASGA